MTRRALTTASTTTTSTTTTTTKTTTKTTTTTTTTTSALTIRDEESAYIDVAAVCGDEKGDFGSARDPGAFLLFVDDVVERRRVE